MLHIERVVGNAVFILPDYGYLVTTTVGLSPVRTLCLPRQYHNSYYAT
jgi:hypothetical protein